MNFPFDLHINNGYVLAAEDSVVQAKKLMFFFESNSISYKICINGKDALDQAKLEKPLLIISDIVMPVMDGYAFCTAIKNDPELFDTPFILLTALSDPLDIIKGLQAGADNFITKPYEENYLKSRINYLLTNKVIRQNGAGDMSIEIIFQSQKFQINSDKKQILDLLLSVYEAAISRNTQLIEVQQQLQKANEDLKSANYELEAFSRTVSHDLRTPLNGVIGFADLLAQDYGHLLDKDGNEYIQWILKSAGNMSQLIDDLLHFARSSTAELKPEKVDLSSMVEQIVGELRKSNFKADYTIRIQESISAVADPKMLKVVMTNLISNALKYSQKKENPEVVFGQAIRENKAIYYIKDNGAGFDPTKADNLFKPFIRLHGSNDFQGTGVGLSTVKRIIERHGGSIWFESALGKGTVFYFTLE